MHRCMNQLLFILMTLLVNWTAAHSQDNFYRGKTVRIIVGASAGGGYDTYTRTIARHMGKHIPGNPTLVVDNMPGDRKSTRLNSSHSELSRMPSSA